MPWPDPNPLELVTPRKTFVFCVPTCVQTCPCIRALLWGSGPWTMRIFRVFLKATHCNEWSRLAARPAANTFSKRLALGWLRWHRTVNRLLWRDLSRSQWEFMPMLPSKMHFPCVWFSKQAANWEKKKLISLISNHNSSWCEVMLVWSDSLLSTQEGNTLWI